MLFERRDKIFEMIPEEIFEKYFFTYTSIYYIAGHSWENVQKIFLRKFLRDAKYNGK